MRLFALAILLSSATFAAERPQHYADPGALAISNDFQASIGYLGYNGSGAFKLNLNPAADYFLQKRISVGAQIGFNLLAGNGSTTKSFSFTPRVGIDLPLAEGVTLWPRFGLQLQTGDFTLAGLPLGGLSQTTFGIAFEAPVLWHVGEHFFLGVGPNVVAQFVGDIKQTSFTIDFTLGGWL